MQVKRYRALCFEPLCAALFAVVSDAGDSRIGGGLCAPKRFILSSGQVSCISGVYHHASWNSTAIIEDEEASLKHKAIQQTWRESKTFQFESQVARGAEKSTCEHTAKL